MGFATILRFDTTAEHTGRSTSVPDGAAPGQRSPRPQGPAALSDCTGNEPLMTAAEVGAHLRVPAKKVYELAIPRVRLSESRVRFTWCDVRAYLAKNRSAR